MTFKEILFLVKIENLEAEENINTIQELLGIAKFVKAIKIGNQQIKGVKMKNWREGQLIENKDFIS